MRYVQEVVNVLPKLKYFDTVDMNAAIAGQTTRGGGAVGGTSGKILILFEFV